MCYGHWLKNDGNVFIIAFNLELVQAEQLKAICSCVSSSDEYARSLSSLFVLGDVFNVWFVFLPPCWNDACVYNVTFQSIICQNSLPSPLPPRFIPLPPHFTEGVFHKQD